MPDDASAQLTALPEHFLLRTTETFTGSRGIRQKRYCSQLQPILWPSLSAAGLDTALRVGHFLAQVYVETFQLSDMEEEASGADYEGRRDLGNTARGDGESTVAQPRRGARK